jgi:glycosyltransferase involved in cell wall biosynthesis
VTRVSALITTYNHERFVAQAVESVLHQTFRDFEVLIADDGSRDRTVDIARGASGTGSLIESGPHLGFPGNWARGLAGCGGELVAFLSGDDTWMDDHLAVAVAALDAHPAAAFSYSYNEHVDEQLRPLSGDPGVVPDHPSGWVDPSRLLGPNVLETHSVVVRRAAIETVGGIDGSLLLADVDLFLRLARHYQVVHTGEVTARYRRHDSGMSRDPQLMLEGWLAVLERHLDGAGPLSRRRLLAGRYADAADEQARLRGSAGSPDAVRRNLVRAVRTWPPVLFDRRCRSAARVALQPAAR